MELVSGGELFDYIVKNGKVTLVLDTFSERTVYMGTLMIHC